MLILNEKLRNSGRSRAAGARRPGQRDRHYRESRSRNGRDDAGAGSAGTLAVGGTAFSESGVVQLLSRLGLVPDLSSIALTSSTADPKTGVVTFSITAQVAPPSSIAVAAAAAGGVTS